MGQVDLIEINKYLQQLPDDHFSVMESWKAIKLDTYPSFVKQFQQLVDGIHVVASSHFRILHIIPLVSKTDLQRQTIRTGDDPGSGDDDDDDDEVEHSSSPSVILSPYSPPSTQQLCISAGDDRVMLIEIDTPSAGLTNSQHTADSNSSNDDPLPLRYCVLQSEATIETVQFYDENALFCFISQPNECIFGIAKIRGEQTDDLQSIAVHGHDLLQNDLELCDVLREQTHATRHLHIDRYQFYEHMTDIIACNHRRGLAALYSREHRIISLYDLEAQEDELQE